MAIFVEMRGSVRSNATITRRSLSTGTRLSARRGRDQGCPRFRHRRGHSRAEAGDGFQGTGMIITVGTIGYVYWPSERGAEVHGAWSWQGRRDAGRDPARRAEVSGAMNQGRRCSRQALRRVIRRLWRSQASHQRQRVPHLTSIPRSRPSARNGRTCSPSGACIKASTMPSPFTPLRGRRLQGQRLSVCEAGCSRSAFPAEKSGTDLGYARRGRCRRDRIAESGRAVLIRIEDSNSLAAGRCEALAAGHEDAAERQ